jgi:hypothetical protein
VGRETHGDERLVVVENASDAPVHDVKAWLVRPGTALPAGGVPDKKPTTQRTHLLANSSLEYPLRTTGSAPEKRPPVVVTFTDAEGQPWLRDADGRLTKPNAR